MDRLIGGVRNQADRFIFLSGGAGGIASDTQDRVLGLLDALRLLAEAGVRIAVGDGGTQFGIMAAAGRSRSASHRPFPLIGTAPAAEVLPVGASESTPIDPGHSHLVAVDNPGWQGDHGEGGEAWGSETEAMYRIFGCLARDRPSVAVIINGGWACLAEVAENLRQDRRMIVVRGSGRVADTLSALLEGGESGPEGSRQSFDPAFGERARSLGVAARPELFRFVDLEVGADGLAKAVEAALEEQVRGDR